MAKTYVTGGLYVDHEQLVKRLNLPAAASVEFFQYLEGKLGFPKPEADFGGKRYFPAVVAWFDADQGLDDRRPYFIDDDVEAWKKYPPSTRKKRKSRWGE